MDGNVTTVVDVGTACKAFPERRITEVRAKAQVRDQVVRLEQWQATHPGVDIQNPDYASGGQFWVARKGGEVVCREYELRVLLDHLDWFSAQDQPAHA